MAKKIMGKMEIMKDTNEDIEFTSTVGYKLLIPKNQILDILLSDCEEFYKIFFGVEDAVGISCIIIKENYRQLIDIFGIKEEENDKTTLKYLANAEKLIKLRILREGIKK